VAEDRTEATRSAKGATSVTARRTRGVLFALLIRSTCRSCTALPIEQQT
jgi:hypothetical protein